MILRLFMFPKPIGVIPTKSDEDVLFLYISNDMLYKIGSITPVLTVNTPPPPQILQLWLCKDKSHVHRYN